MSRHTVPAWQLAALGGLVDEDPPVLMRVAGCAVLQAPMHPSVEIDDDQPEERYLEGIIAGFDTLPDHADLLLPQSAPALLRVLARYFGLELDGGEVPRLAPWTGLVGVERGRWYVHLLDRAFEADHECLALRADQTLKPDEALPLLFGYFATVKRVESVLASCGDQFPGLLEMMRGSAADQVGRPALMLHLLDTSAEELEDIVDDFVILDARLSRGGRMQVKWEARGIGAGP